MPVSARMSWATRAQWLAVGLIAWLVLVFFTVGMLHTSVGEQVDQTLAGPLIHGLPGWLRAWLSLLARPWLVVATALLVAVLVVRALTAHRLTAALTGILIPASCLLWLSQLRTGWLGLGTDAFPSGHAVAGLALLASTAVLWPRPAPWWARGVAGVAAAVVTAGNVTLHAHRPGEVIAALLLVVAVTGVLLGTLAPRPVRVGPPTNRGTMGPP